MLGYWKIGPQVSPADLTAGRGGNWGVTCPEDDSLDNLGEMVGGWPDGGILYKLKN